MGIDRFGQRGSVLYRPGLRRLGAVWIGLSLVLAGCTDSVGGEIEPAVVVESADLVGRDGLTRPLSLTDPSDTPPVDVFKASVPLESIVFDTFDGGSITLAEADDDIIARLFDAIAPIDAPNYSTVEEGGQWLTDDDVVVGFVDQADQAWAYPVRILNGHEIVNDELSGQPILISYCPLCGSGVVFDRRLDDRLLSFSNTSALHQNDLVMVDRETGSYWWQLAGRALVGALNGQSLTALPAETTSWQSWRDRHPETLVMERPEGRNYDRDSFLGIGNSLDQGRTPFPVDAEVFADDRLPPSARVVIVEVGSETMAYPTSPARTVEDVVGGQAISVMTDGVGAVVNGADGPLATRSSYWYAARAAFPDIAVGA